MPFSITGDFGKAIFSSKADDSGRVSSRYLSINTEASLNFIRRLTIVKSNIVANSFGLFSFRQFNRDGKLRFASLSRPRHLLSKCKTGCTWGPKGKMAMDVSEISSCCVEYNGEQCPDVFVGDCLEKIYGVGNDRRNLMATPEGKVIFREMINSIYLALGDSFYDVVWYGQHPLIDAADANDWYDVNDDEWEAYKDQQDACAGIMTMIDWLKHDGLPNFNVEIHKQDISEDFNSYIGVATDLFDRVLAAQNPIMKMAAKKSTNTGSMQKSVILADPKVFRKYEEEMMAEWGTHPEMLQYFFNAQFCQQVGCAGNTAVPGTLLYKGHLVVCMDEWEQFDAMTGTNTCRVIATCPGNFGIGYDLKELNQFQGFGMRITQHLDAPFQGMVYMDTIFKIGMGIIDPSFMVNASITMTPQIAA